MKIDLISTGTADDNFMYLLEGSLTSKTTILESDDRDGGNNNARIIRRLGPGTYTIVATTDAKTTTGSYTLTVKALSSTPAAALYPLPSTFPFFEDGRLHRFTVGANVPVNVVVNPTGYSARMGLTDDSDGNPCPAIQNATLSKKGHEVVYMAGCSSGSVTIRILDASNNSTLKSYEVSIDEMPALEPNKSVCMPVKDMAASRSSTSRTTVNLSWVNVSGGLTESRKEVEIKKISTSVWRSQAGASGSPTTKSMVRSGVDSDTSYAYRVRTKCSNKYSRWTGWSIVGPRTGGGVSGEGGDDVMPTPTPRPRS